jgi:hypothetical protein
MKPIKQCLFGLGIFLVLMAVPAFAHHPFAPEFDWKKPVTLTGIVTKVEWMNPHALVSIDVRDELGSPRVLEKKYRWNVHSPTCVTWLIRASSYCVPEITGPLGLHRVVIAWKDSRECRRAVRDEENGFLAA